MSDRNHMIKVLWHKRHKKNIYLRDRKKQRSAYSDILYYPYQHSLHTKNGFT